MCAADVLTFPSHANLGNQVGFGIEVSEVSPTGSQTALRSRSVFKAPEFTIDSDRPNVKWEDEVFESLATTTRLSKLAARAKTKDVPGFSAAARYNATALHTRLDSHVYASLFVDAHTQTRRLKINPIVREIAKDKLDPEVVKLGELLAVAVAQRKWSDAASIRSSFRKQFGTGLLLAVDEGAIFRVEYARVIGNQTARDEVIRVLKVAVANAQAGVATNDKAIETIRLEIERTRGEYIGTLNESPLSPGMTVEAARAALIAEKGSWLRAVTKDPKGIRFHYLPYSDIPFLAQLATGAPLEGPQLAAVEGYFGELTADSHAFVRELRGWSDQVAYWTVPLFIATRLDSLESGHLGVVLEIDAGPLDACRPAPSTEKQPIPPLDQLCKATAGGPPLRLVRWHDVKAKIRNRYVDTARQVVDPSVASDAVLTAEIVRVVRDLPSSQWPAYSWSSQPARDWPTVQAIADSQRGQAEGFRQRFPLTDDDLVEFKSDLRGGLVAVRTLLTLPSGISVAFLPKELPGTDFSAKVAQITHGVVPRDQVRALVATLNEMNKDHLLKRGVKLWESGCSEGAIEFGSPHCIKKWDVGTNRRNNSCDKRQGHLSCTEGGLIATRNICRFGLYDLAKKAPIPNWKGETEVVGGPAGVCICQAVCANRDLGRFAIEAPLPSVPVPQR